MMAEKLLEINGLRAGIEGKEILKGLDLSVNKGEVHDRAGERLEKGRLDGC